MARRLLELRQIPLHTIAEKCGYSSTSYFINTFRQYYGVTPHQFSQHSPGTFFLTYFAFEYWSGSHVCFM